MVLKIRKFCNFHCRNFVIFLLTWNVSNSKIGTSFDLGYKVMIYISAYYDFSKCGSYVTLILPSPLIEMIQTSLRLLHDLAIEKILTEHLEMFFNRTEAVKNIYVNKN